MKHAIQPDHHLGKWFASAALGAVAMYLLIPPGGATVSDAASAGAAAPPLPDDTLETAADTPPASDTAPALAAIQDDASAPAARWGNSARGAAIAGGGALGLYGLLSSRSPLGLALGLVGLSLLARGASNRPLRSMLSAASHGAPVTIEKTIRIAATPEEVYDLFAHCENFPRFMPNVLEVCDLGEYRTHWLVKGPAGTEFAWNAVLTEHERPRRLAWHSEPGAEITQAGTIWFEPFRNSTRVTVRVTYQPPAGAAGQALASLLGSDPKRQLDDDLARMKALVERGAMRPGQATASAPDAPGATFLH